MPSEVIYGQGGVDVRVSWGTNETGPIQVVSQAAKSDNQDPTGRLIGVVNEWLKAAGEQTIDLAKVRAAMPFEPFFDGWWAELSDWGQVNRLIRTLQRARDRVFGSPA